MVREEQGAHFVRAARLDAGEPDSPVLLHVPHASRALPWAVRRRILLDDRAPAAELD